MIRFVICASALVLAGVLAIVPASAQQTFATQQAAQAHCPNDIVV